ncbi:hypothetical protein MLD38_004808 [Melastoma candidum]|uniref:Uncharacterized protein n=1 Tax=Melastoma candidum TaxID=119954 RepID=A0ACB9S6X1_9MYRT|nr:hypothetical protein MLD38_004808 [Melastoma candidum]
MTLKERVCNPDVYPRHQWVFSEEKDYECAVNGIFNSIMTETPQRQFLQFYSNQSCYGSSKIAYGYGFCHRRLIPAECTDCLNEAKGLLFDVCTHSIGARVVLEDCQIRYENYPFFGPP